MKKNILIFILFLSANTLSAPSWHSEKIKSIYPNADGTVVLTFATPSDCPKENGYHYIAIGENGVTELGVKNMLSVALTAAAMDKKVSVNFDNGHPNCAINRLYLTY